MLFGEAYTRSVDESTGVNIDMEQFMESCIVDEVSKLSDEKIQEFCAPGGMGESLVEAGKLRRKTLVRLSKQDDLERRQTMAALQLAKEHNDPTYNLLVKNRIKEKEYLAKIRKKYGTQAVKVAKTGQKDWLKKRLPGFMRGNDTNSVR